MHLQLSYKLLLQAMSNQRLCLMHINIPKDSQLKCTACGIFDITNKCQISQTNKRNTLKTPKINNRRPLAFAIKYSKIVLVARASIIHVILITTRGSDL